MLPLLLLDAGWYERWICPEKVPVLADGGYTPYSEVGVAVVG